ncbi:FAD binding protein [Aureococcus anophagefferens]|nr:FAD binding protein [Aureococcus anophagefferens]
MGLFASKPAPYADGETSITIVGAGLVGSLLAVVLRSKGYDVRIFERYGDIRAIPSVGRSINLVATVRGLRALRALPPDVCERLLQLGTKVTGRVIHTTDGEALFQRYGKDDSEFNYSISRYELNKFLLSEAERAGAEIRFGHRLVGVDPEGVTLTFDKGDGAFDVTCLGPVLACDGGGSGVRKALGDVATEALLDSGYKEMLFPKGTSLETHGLHIWPRGTHFLMALANLDGSFTGTIYMVNEGDGATFASLENGGVEAAEKFLEEAYGDALAHLGGAKRAAEQLVKNPRGILGTVRTKTWAFGGKLALVGDAAHAIVPFFGQGMNCGFEDVDRNANAIADMALENYVEMMDRTGDPDFRKAKAVENALENSALGSRFRSRYAMVCYGGGRQPGGVQYDDALQLGKVQWDIVCELAAGLDDPENAAEHLDEAKAAALLDSKLAPLQAELGVDLSTISHHA